MSSTLSSDNSLIARLCQHDTQALGMFYDRYGTLVYTLALRITGNHADAEAVSLDVFQMCWQSAATFRGNNVAAWVISITRHYALRALHACDDQVIASIGIYELEHTLTVSESTDGSVDAETMRTALSVLPIEQREAIELAYYSGLRSTTIATRLGRPSNMVKTYLRQALQVLYAQVRVNTKE